MSRVLSHMTMSLDGYIAQPDDQVGELFDWYEAGDGLRYPMRRYPDAVNAAAGRRACTARRAAGAGLGRAGRFPP